MNIMVFMGGSSSEREISLMSGEAVTAGLRKAGHDAVPVDVQWVGDDSLFRAVDRAVASRIDVVFLILHGGLGENGGVQGVLEAAGLTYTGSGITGSALAMDKVLSKMLFRSAHIPTPDWIPGPAGSLDARAIGNRLGYPIVIKPVNQGSSVGVSVVDGPDCLLPAIPGASVYGDIMAEAYVPGAELAVPVLGGEALPVIEIKPSHGIYDYECKYTSGMSQYLVPAPIDGELTAELQALALDVCRLLGLRDLARIDFRLDGNGQPLCIEANTLPGMTATSLVPKSAAHAGIGFPELVSRIAEMAYRRKG